MAMHRPQHITFDRKITFVLDREMAATTAAIVLAHLAMALGGHADDLLGNQLVDGSGNVHPGLVKYPAVLLQAPASLLKELIRRSKAAGALVVVFPRQALDIWFDEHLVADLRTRTEQEIEFLGFGLFSTPKLVSQLTGSLALYRPQAQ